MRARTRAPVCIVGPRTTSRASLSPFGDAAVDLVPCLNPRISPRITGQSGDVVACLCPYLLVFQAAGAFVSTACFRSLAVFFRLRRLGSYLLIVRAASVSPDASYFNRFSSPYLFILNLCLHPSIRTEGACVRCMYSCFTCPRQFRYISYYGNFQNYVSTFVSRKHRKADSDTSSR